MTRAPLNLIRSTSRVTPGMPARGRAPNLGVVYATASGQLGFYPDWRPMRYGEQIRTAYRRRFDVDMSHHRRRALLEGTPLPSRGDFSFFIADVEVGFRVHDPEEIVRRNVTEATRVVYSHLSGEFRRITRKYDIEDAELAESEILDRFSVDDILREGICIDYVAPRLRPDESASRHLRKKRGVERQVQIDRAKHRVRLEAARQRGELDRLNRLFEHEMAELEFRRMEGRALDAHEIIRLHLARHPEDTEGALDLIIRHRKAWMEHQEQYNRRTAELFQSMVSSNLVQAADMERLLPQMLGQLGVVPPPVPVEATTGFEWTEPPVFAPGERPEMVTTPEPGVQPVYLVLDESAQAEPVLPFLNDLLPGMLAALAQVPALRLAVLGFARHLTVRLPLDVVTAGTRVPMLSAGEPAAYAVLFAALADHIDADLAVLPEAASDPLVYVLCASTAEDNWMAARQRLTDPELRPRPPKISAFGSGDASPELVAGIATDASNAFLTSPGTDPATAVAHFAEFVVSDILDRIDHPYEDRMNLPDGFHPSVEAP
ncbi:MAG: hypothetical protein ABW022_22380 [Actinoplanes sp.]